MVAIRHKVDKKHGTIHILACSDCTQLHSILELTNAVMDMNIRNCDFINTFLAVSIIYA